tara:strand:+ start:295 stop:807 length:513 start_codon:yes stop_codon:yes gene_type:complete
MLRSKKFYKFFKKAHNNNQEIVKYNSNQEFDLQDQIKDQIIEIDKKISENNKALVEAQIVKLRSSFSKSNNFIEKIGANLYKVKLDESITWHQRQLKELYFTRKNLIINLEKLTGIFWLNRIKRLLSIIFIGFFILLSLFIFFSGFILIIYLLPIISLILLGYLISNKKY